MRAVLALAAVLAAGLAVAACGGGKGKAKAVSASSEDRVKARLVALFDLVRQDKTEEAAEFVLYRGADPARAWKDVSKPENPAEKDRVEGACAEIKALLALGPPTFVKFQAHAEEEGLRLTWMVAFGTGKEAKTHSLSFFETPAGLALSEID